MSEQELSSLQFPADQDRPPGRVSSRAGRMAVELAAIGITATILVGLALGFQPVVLTTGSMAPAAPAGSLVIVADTPADEVEIDDIIVMQRGSSTLVTHRVVELQAGSEGPAAVTKGDANPSPDPRPYLMDGDQRVVRVTIPRAGRVLLPLIENLWLVVIAMVAVGWWLTFRSGREKESATGSKPNL